MRVAKKRRRVDLLVLAEYLRDGSAADPWVRAYRRVSGYLLAFLLASKVTGPILPPAHAGLDLAPVGVRVAAWNVATVALTWAVVRLGRWVGRVAVLAVDEARARRDAEVMLYERWKVDGT
jgi:hypothetical protein